MSDPQNSPMNAEERRAAWWLSGIFALRMLGLFMILPVFALYAEHLQGSTPALAGLAIGIYGLSQAICQMPFGVLSDRYGRKPVIAFGLLIFAIGSAVAAQSDTIDGVLIGRSLQGAGAISAAVMALAADLTREVHRIKIMAAIGMTMGLSFALSLIMGPILGHWIGVPGIFWLTGGLALLSIAVIYGLVPNPPPAPPKAPSATVLVATTTQNAALRRLNVGIFILHFLLTSTFVALPLVLRRAGWQSDTHWQIYLPVLLGAMAMMMPFLRRVQRQKATRPILLGAIAALVLAEAGLAFGPPVGSSIALWLWIFFSGFNLLEAMLPTIVSRMAPPEAKGRAMGFYASSQFLGAFAGGAIGGMVRGSLGLSAVFCTAMLAAGVWFWAAYTAPKC